MCDSIIGKIFGHKFKVYPLSYAPVPLSIVPNALFCTYEQVEKYNMVIEASFKPHNIVCCSRCGIQAK